MFRLNKLSDYAAVLMACLAEDGERVSAQALAERARLELPTVAKLLKQLSSAGLVNATRGTTGGYVLARAAEHISVADIVIAIEGPMGLTECSVHQGGCSRESFCAISSNLRKISMAVEHALRSVTLADLSAPPKNWRPRVSIERTLEIAP